MESTYSILLSRLEKAVDALYELAERYALYKSHHAWSSAYDACEVWKRAVEIAYRTVEALEGQETIPSEEDINRLSSILFYVRELSRVSHIILSDGQAPSRERQ